LVGLSAIVLIIGSGVLWFTWPYLFHRAPYIYEPEMIGHIQVGAEAEEGRRLVRPGSRTPVELSFETRKGTARGVKIILDLGGLDLLGASQDWSITEGKYVWRYTSIRKGAINLTMQTPVEHGVEHTIRLWYAYTNEDPVSVDNQTILTTSQDPENVPGEESTGQIRRPFPSVFAFALVILLLFLYSRKRRT
jgi:hypothetical protein